MKRLAIIDGKSVFYRGYYAMPNLSLSDGTPTGGVYGFAALSLEMIKKLKPDYVAVAWDKPKTNIRKRKELYPQYKAGRKPAPPDFYAQLPMLYELLEAFHWPLYELDDYEADDIMGALAHQAVTEHDDIEVCLITSDLDSLQLIGEKTNVYILKKGFSQIDLFNPTSFEARYGISVHQFLDLKALKGDSSDNIPGVPGVGEKTALQLLKDYQTLDGVYEHLGDIKETLQKKLQSGRDSAYLSKQIAEIWLDAPAKLDLDAMDVNACDTAKVKGLLQQYEFKSLLRNLPANMQHVEPAQLADAPIVKPVPISSINDELKVSLTMASQLFVYTHQDNWLVAANNERAVSIDVKLACQLLNGSSVVAHDSKELLHELLRQGSKYQDMPLVAHDTRIAGFMLNSLSKNRTLQEVSGVDLTNDSDGSLGLAALIYLHAEQQKAFADLPKVAELAQMADFPLIQVLARMEHYGMNLDTAFLKIMSQELGERLEKLDKQIQDHAGYEFNIGSPAQLADVLYGKLQLSTLGIKKGKTAYSTGASELEKLHGAHPIIDLIIHWRELSKLKNTYVDALPKLVDDNNRLHTNFRQDVASTGRLSSFEPNLQNIPIRTDEGRKIRRAFTPKSGNVFVSADYSQFELRLAAVLAGDKQMMADFEAGIDIHAKTAGDVLGKTHDQVTKAERRDAKVINFGVLYGMSPHGLANATGMSFADAKSFIDEYFRLRAPVKRYIDETLERAKNQGYVETLLGRRRPTPDVNSSNFAVREAAKRAAANMPIQGTEADLMKLAMIEVDKKLEPDCVQVLQIHDSILVECPKAKAEAVGKMLKDTMENVYPKLGISLQVDISTGNNWGEI